VEGNPKLTLGLIWTIILHFQVSAPWQQRVADATDAAVTGKVLSAFSHSSLLHNVSMARGLRSLIILSVDSA
jgi:hypothetical protein